VLAATHGPPAKRKAGGSYHRSSRIIRHSLRDGFNAYSVLSLGTGLSCSHRPRDHHLARLTPASGCQDHTPLPSANATFVQRDIRVHRSPASRVVTIAIRPLHRGGMTEANHKIPKNGRIIFLRQRLDNGISVESPREFRFFAHAMWHDSKHPKRPARQTGLPRRANQFARATDRREDGERSTAPSRPTCETLRPTTTDRAGIESAGLAGSTGQRPNGGSDDRPRAAQS
jgi:hypothetical protein